MRRKPTRGNVSAIPRTLFQHKSGYIEISNDTIIISGPVEDAAWAMANECLKMGKDNNNTNWRYFSTLEVTLREGSYDLTLLKSTAMEATNWGAFKKNVEKICNKLTAFM